MSGILERIKTIENDIIQFRRKLHRFPELSGQESETQRSIISELERWGVPCTAIGGTSVMAVVKGRADGRTLVLRADIDALPLSEQSGVDFASENPGVMHACGHDAHTAMLAGAARILQDMRGEFTGEVRCVFQEAEETGQGSRILIEAGVLDRADGIFGMHAMPSLDTGQVSFYHGYITAASDTIRVRFQGVSGHGSSRRPDSAAIDSAARFTVGLQSLVTKLTAARDPVVLTVGRIQGGTQINSLAKSTELELTMRSFDPETRDTVIRAIRRHALSLAQSWNIEAAVELSEGSPSVYSDDKLSELADKSVEKALGPGRNIRLDPIMASDDVAWYLRRVPGVYGSIGYRNSELETIYPPHHDKYKIDEAFLKYGAAVHVQFALDFLALEAQD